MITAAYSLRQRASFLLSTFFVLMIALIMNAPLQAAPNTQPDAQFVAPKKKLHPTPQKIEKEAPIEMNGALVKAFQSGRPWEMVNPFAPADYGNGETIISEDPDELGKENGVTFFGISW